MFFIFQAISLGMLLKTGHNFIAYFLPILMQTLPEEQAYPINFYSLCDPISPPQLFSYQETAQVFFTIFVSISWISVSWTNAHHN